MNIKLSDGAEILTINTSIIWYLQSHRSFNDVLSEALTNLEDSGYKVITDVESYDYLMDNLPQFIKAVK